MADLPIRELSDFNDKTFVRHIIDSHNSVRYGVIDKDKNVVLCEGKEYSLNQFAFTHLQKHNPDRKSVNAWAECECQLGGYWVSMERIKKY
jgi:hypothetical protein